jgi:hypothetical protein
LLSEIGGRRGIDAGLKIQVSLINALILLHLLFRCADRPQRSNVLIPARTPADAKNVVNIAVVVVVKTVVGNLIRIVPYHPRQVGMIPIDAGVNDGYNDDVEIREGSDPLNRHSIPADFDGDFDPDSTDPDEIQKIIDTIADPIGTFYRFSLPDSTLRRVQK